MLQEFSPHHWLRSYLPSAPESRTWNGQILFGQRPCDIWDEADNTLCRCGRRASSPCSSRSIAEVHENQLFSNQVRKMGKPATGETDCTLCGVCMSRPVYIVIACVSWITKQDLSSENRVAMQAHCFLSISQPPHSMFNFQCLPLLLARVEQTAKWVMPIPWPLLASLVLNAFPRHLPNPHPLV